MQRIFNNKNIEPFLSPGKVATDNFTLSELNLKPNLKIMMMGSLEEAIEGAMTKPDVGDEVVNDLDIEEEEVDVENQEVSFLIIPLCQ